jgi:hypothetical protein
VRIEIGQDPNGSGSWRDKVTLCLEEHDIPRSVIIKRGDRTIAEVFANVVSDHETMWHEVERARRLEMIPTVLLGMAREVVGSGGVSERNRAYYFDGVVDGMKQAHPQHALDGKFHDDDQKAIRYVRGYWDGNAIYVACSKVVEMKRSGPEPMLKG